MARYWNTGDFKQPTEAEIKRKVSATKKQEKKKGKELAPVLVTGRTIAKNWWGRAWCENLERYADYANRIDR